MIGSHGAKGNMKQNSGGKQDNPFDQIFKDLTDKMGKEGMSPKEAMGLSGSYLENLYAQAYRLYNTGKYSEATHLFRLLVMFNALEPKYMLGLAACLHMMKEYVSAIQTYTLCSALDPNNPIPHYHSSDCFIQMKEHLSAMLCLELAIESCSDNKDYAKMKERAQMSLESLKQQAISTPLNDNPRSVTELKQLF